MTTKAKVLVVDDDADLGTIIAGQLRQEGYTAESVTSAHRGLARLESASFDLVLSDIRMPKMNGLELLKEVKKRWSDVPVIMITAHASIDIAVECMRAGAATFLVKPHDQAQLIAAVDDALKLAEWHARRPPERDVPGLLGEAELISALKRDIDRASRAQSNVLLRGETGTGKEVAARSIHAMSRRRNAPFIAVHCAALQDGLFASELFGHVKGAFTGAIQDRPGRVALAEGGTLFLDEIGDVSASMQVKLLRLIQEKTYEAVGDSRPRQANVRFIAATNRDLKAMVAEGTFREDLYYRLTVIPLWLPPLRDIREDIPKLARAFLRRFASENDRSDLEFSVDAIGRLAAHDFPGNVRELENLVERLVVFAGRPSTIEVDDIEREVAREVGPPSARLSGEARTAVDLRSDAYKRSALAEALGKAGGSRSKAARLLGISRRTIYNWMERFGYEDSDLRV